MQILPGNCARSYAAHHLMSPVRSAFDPVLRTHSLLSDVFTFNRHRGTYTFDCRNTCCFQ